MEGMEVLQKRMRTAEGSEGDGGGRGGDAGMEEEAETTLVGSEEMEMEIQRIHEKMEQFTQQVSDLLEAGKTVLRDLSAEFEERLITIHKEQMEKWQDEIKEVRMVDGSNEAARALLQNAQQHILHNVGEDSSC